MKRAEVTRIARDMFSRAGYKSDGNLRWTKHGEDVRVWAAFSKSSVSDRFVIRVTFFLAPCASLTPGKDAHITTSAPELLGGQRLGCLEDIVWPQDGVDQVAAMETLRAVEDLVLPALQGLLSAQGLRRAYREGRFQSAIIKKEVVPFLEAI